MRVEVGPRVGEHNHQLVGERMRYAIELFCGRGTGANVLALHEHVHLKVERRRLCLEEAVGADLVEAG